MDRSLKTEAGRRRRASRAGTVVALSLLAWWGCSNNGSGGNGMIPVACLEFAASAVAAPGTVTATEGGNSTCDVAVVDLIVTDVDGLYGTAFHVNYDPDVVRLSSVSASGSVLGSNVDSFANQVAAGDVSVGVTRLSGDTVDVVGGALLVRLTFARVASDDATSGLSFSEASLQDGSEPPEPIPGIVFRGGTFMVTTS